MNRHLSQLSTIRGTLPADLEIRPVVARRHYIESGNLRYFDVRYVPVATLDEAITSTCTSADGHIVVPLVETPAERAEAIRLAQSASAAERPDVLVAVPQPLAALSGLVDESRRWHWIAENTPELNSDRYAAEEVSRQIARADEALRNRLLDFVGLRQSTGRSELEWFRGSRPVAVRSGRELLELLSDVADELYPEAPRVANELLNRRSLSSSAAAARLRLIERLFEHSGAPLLGMDPTKKPPEMSMYLSVVRAGRLHRQRGEVFTLGEPRAAEDPLRLLPSLRAIRALLDETPDRRIPVTAVFDRLRRPPYGVRDGLIPVLLAAFAVANERDLAFYEHGAFVRHLTGREFHRLIKAPQTFEMQYCRVVGSRANLFERLVAVFGVSRVEPSRTEILDVVRPLAAFAAQLPAYTHKTDRLSARAVAVRDALLAATEPTTLLFADLPRACGFAPISPRRTSGGDIDAFVGALKATIEELRFAYAGLLDRVLASIQQAFESGEPLEAFRARLADRAERMLIAASEPRLKAFCMRLIDPNLPQAEWLESVASFVVSKPPNKWLDADEETFANELASLVRRFLRAETLAFEKGAGGHTASAVRVALTRPDGSEIDRIVHLDGPDTVEIAKLEAYITELLHKNRAVGLSAATRALWNLLSETERSVQ